MKQIPGKITLLIFKILRRILMHVLRPLFKKYGKNFIFDPFGVYSFSNIEIGEDVFIGAGAKIISEESYIKIGNKVMLGPNVSLIAGSHNIHEIGKYMFDVKNKRPENDLPIIIENDVWIASNVTVLMGVKIGEGSVVGAGSVVTKNVPPFSFVAGVPAKWIKNRFTDEEILKHKQLI